MSFFCISFIVIYLEITPQEIIILQQYIIFC